MTLFDVLWLHLPGKTEEITKYCSLDCQCFTLNANQALPEYRSAPSTRSVWCSWTL